MPSRKDDDPEAGEMKLIEWHRSVKSWDLATRTMFQECATRSRGYSFKLPALPKSIIRMGRSTRKLGVVGVRRPIPPCRRPGPGSLCGESIAISCIISMVSCQCMQHLNADSHSSRHCGDIAMVVVLADLGLQDQNHWSSSSVSAPYWYSIQVVPTCDGRTRLGRFVTDPGCN